MTDAEYQLVDFIAQTLCDDPDARLIAGKTDAPDYHDSPPDVRDFWQAIARAAVTAFCEYPVPLEKLNG